MSDIDKMLKYLKAELQSIVSRRRKMERSAISGWTSKAAKSSVIASLVDQEMLLYYAIGHARGIKERTV